MIQSTKPIVNKKTEAEIKNNIHFYARKGTYGILIRLALIF